MAIAQASDIDPGLVELYTQGSCHVFAIACARTWPEHFRCFRVVFDADEMSWEDPEDPDNGIGAVIHVWAILEVEGDLLAVDIRQVLPESQAQGVCEELFGAWGSTVEDFPSEAAMEWLIEGRLDDEAEGFRPLHEVEQADILAAMAVIREIFPDGTPPRMQVTQDPLF